MKKCGRCKDELLEEYTFKLCEKCKKYSRDYKAEKRKAPMSNEELSWSQFLKKETEPQGAFGKQLKQCMLENLESPKTLAKTLGVDPNTINSWLYNEQIPRNIYDRHKRIANVFFMDVDDLKLYK